MSVYTSVSNDDMQAWLQRYALGELVELKGIAAGITNSETRDTYDGHTWNAAKLDSEWYQIDCTWDDTTLPLLIRRTVAQPIDTSDSTAASPVTARRRLCRLSNSHLAVEIS